MTEKQDLRSRLVVGRRRDGRREFDEAAVQELVELCLKPGVSIARAAMDHDVNPNQLRRWISRYQQHMPRAPRDPDPIVIDGASIDVSGSRGRSPVDMRSPSDRFTWRLTRQNVVLCCSNMTFCRVSGRRAALEKIGDEVLYVYRCPACGHRGETRRPEDDAHETARRPPARAATARSRSNGMAG
ncbi:transposase family protein [Burkholderia sp. MSHR3999]|uniref:transposase n=1 Tax=Burkholderia sp. MSHR3999 TaxID=1542965 RepID=UPI0005B69FD4|nr:transposase [Burkholderia sp. MSHR3999]KIP17118.1 transposase family protein [Burkholderia sp. MSHR3999]